MQDIKIFNPDKGNNGEYELYYQCQTCDKYFIDIKEVYLCRTCKKDVCFYCKDIDHTNHDTTKTDSDIAMSHSQNCPCSACNPDLYGFYYPTVDKMETNITMSDDLILLGEGDYNPDMLMAQIPVLSSDFEYGEEGVKITFSDSYQLFSPDETILWREDTNSLGKQINALYKGMNLSGVINKKCERNDLSAIMLFPDSTII